MSKVKLYYRNRSIKSLPKERWYSIIGFEGLYQISNLARVKSLVDNFGRKRKMIKKQWINSDGYPSISMSKEGKSATKTVHRLVAIKFHRNPLKKKHVNHKDSNKKNNLPPNLEWSTEKENSNHARFHGIKMGNFILNKKQVLSISKSKMSSYDLSMRYNVDLKTINNIKTGKAWSKVTGIKHVKLDRQKQLSKDVVLRIYKSKLSGASIAKEYGLSRSVVSHIKTGRTYCFYTKKDNE